MRTLQSKSGYVDIGEAFIADRDFRDDHKATKILIRQAEAVDILSIFKQYGIILDEYNKKMCCPLPHHNEKSASFNYYKDTNSFYCFGCKGGGGPVEFVALMQSIAKLDAANKIISKFEIDPDLEQTTSAIGFIDKQQLFLEFSTLIRSFIRSNLDDENALNYCEKVSMIFDKINHKHKLDTDGLKSLSVKLKLLLEQYKA